MEGDPASTLIMGDPEVGKVWLQLIYAGMMQYPCAAHR